MSERRLETDFKPTGLPVDYLKMVAEVFRGHFGEKVILLKEKGLNAEFQVEGSFYPDEIMISVSLGSPDQVSATTVHASADYDPTASAPTAEELLSGCVDAVGAVYDLLFQNIDRLAKGELSEIPDVPQMWSTLEVNKRTIYVKADKTNLQLDRAADEWLAKNDPAEKEEMTEEEAQAQEQMSERLNVSPKSRHTKH